MSKNHIGQPIVFILVKRNGAWVEHKKLLVAWHYRLVEKDMKLTLMAKAKEIYAKHNFDVLSVSKWFGDNSTRIC